MKFKLTSAFFVTAIICLISYNTSRAADNEHIIKLNLSSAALGNISLQDEYTLNSNSSVCLGLSFLPSRGLPSVATDKDSTNNLINLKVSGFSITPEYRYYVSGHGPKGFYLAPYFRYARYSSDNYVYNYKPNRNFSLSGHWTVAGVGVMIGSQWLLGDHFTFDWWILGACFGKNGGEYNATGTFSASDQADIQSSINDVSVPSGTLKSTITSTSVKVEYTSPTPAIRAFGFCFGYIFGK